MALLIIQHADSCPPGLLGDSLRRFGQRTQIVRVDQGQQLPPNLDDIHGVISLGGPQSCNGTDAWVQPELNVLKMAHTAGIPVLGMCLGAQMLAKALGGQVTRMAKPEIGWTEMKNCAIEREDVLLAGLPWNPSFFSWHNEEVSTPPEGAAVLQSSAACKVQAYRVGPWSYGFQYHPEWNKDAILREIADATPAELAAAGATADAMRAQTNQLCGAAERMAGRIFEMCNLLLFPASRLQPGLEARSPLHH